jgi:hypothetical protein
MNIVQERKYFGVHQWNNQSKWKVANVVIGVFKNSQTLSGKLLFPPYQEISEVKQNNSTCFQCCADCMASWCEILHVVARYRCHTVQKKKTAEGLSVSCPELIYVMCLLHAFHRASETVHMPYLDVDKLVASRKKIFMKSPARMDLFKSKALVTTFPHLQ